MQSYHFMNIRYLISILVFAVVACSPARDDVKTNNTGGTQDWGGGEIRGSTEDEVKRAIETAKIQFSAKLYFSGRDLFWSLEHIHADGPKLEDTQLIKEIISKKPLEVFKTAKITYEMKDCPNVGAKKHAGVSSLSSGATICFNLGELKKLPVTSLNKALIILFAHELAHMLGYEEKSAQQLQTMVQNAFPLFEIVKMFHQYRNMQKDLEQVLEMMNLAFVEHKKQIGSRKFWYAWGEASGKLSSAQLALYHTSTQFESVSINHELLRSISEKLKVHAIFLSGYAHRVLTQRMTLREQESQYGRMEEMFCEIARSYIELEKLTVNFEKEYFQDPDRTEDPIELRHREMGVSCSDIPKEKFKLAEPDQRITFD